MTTANYRVVIRLVDADLRFAFQALSRYMSKTVLTVNILQVRVTLKPPGPVAPGSVAVLPRGLVKPNNLQMIEDTAYFRIKPKPIAAAAGTRSDCRTAG